jgi:hypothetical protein
MSTTQDLISVEDWNVSTGCALDDVGNPLQMLSIKLRFGPGSQAASATLTFLGERGGPGVGSLLGSDLDVQPDPGQFATYWNVLTAGRGVGAYIALDDQGGLLSFFLAFTDGPMP